MNNSLTKWAVAIAAAIGISGAVLAVSTDGGGGSGPLPGCGFGHFPRLNGPLAAVLGLTDAQKKQIKSIVHDAGPSLKPLVEASVREHRALRTAIRTSPVDEAAIRSQSAKVAAVQADLAVQRAELVQKIEKLLTPEQIQQIGRVRESIEKNVDARLSRWGANMTAD